MFAPDVNVHQLELMCWIVAIADIIITFFYVESLLLFSRFVFVIAAFASSSGWPVHRL